MKQKIPNILSISRAILAISVPFVGQYAVLFITVVIICGITDVLDGYLARKWKCQSELGSKLDSLGDWMMGLGITVYLLIWQMSLIINLLVFIVAIIGVRCLSLGVCYWKNRKIYSIHTWLNKFTGIVVFIGICLIPLYKSHPEMPYIFGLALVSSIEELYILLIAKAPDPNLKSIIHLYIR